MSAGSSIQHLHAVFKGRVEGMLPQGYRLKMFHLYVEPAQAAYVVEYMIQSHSDDIASQKLCFACLEHWPVVWIELRQEVLNSIDTLLGLTLEEA